MTAVVAKLKGKVIRSKTQETTSRDAKCAQAPVGTSIPVRRAERTGWADSRVKPALANVVDPVTARGRPTCRRKPLSLAASARVVNAVVLRDVRFGSPSQMATEPAAWGLSTIFRIASRMSSAILRPERAAAMLSASSSSLRR